MKARGGVAAGGLDEPDGRAAVGVAGDARVVVDALEFEIAEEIAVEGQRDRGIEDVHLDVVDEGLHRHQNFSHLTDLRSMPLATSAWRTRSMVSPPPHT